MLLRIFTYVVVICCFNGVVLGTPVADASGAAESLRPCAPRDYGRGSVVCVCNATYCDALKTEDRLPAGQFALYSTSKGGLRFQRNSGQFSTPGEYATGAVTFTLDRSSVYQSVIGFGGAMTDAAAVNIASLSEPAQELLLRSYYSEDGVEYNVARTNIGGCDFSTRPYSYDDEGAPSDPELKHFQLAEEDTKYKIPYLKRMVAMSQRRLYLLGSAWSAPKWMKTNGDFIGLGKLKKEYYQAWAEYYAKFLAEYGAQGLNFWAITAQNEPLDGNIPGFSFNCMGWTPDEQRDWVGNNLGPTLEARGHSDVEILVVDDQRPFLASWTDTLFSDEKVVKYASGIAVHWYIDFISSPEILNTTHFQYPNKYLMYTEACNGESPEEHVILGSWERAEKYAYSVIETMSNWVTGWIDWNLALDLTGGPNWAKNFVDSPVIVNATADEFYKQPMFYALGHFSKFVPYGSKRIGISMNVNNQDSLSMNAQSSDIYAIAFDTPELATAVVFLNKNDQSVEITFRDADRGELTKEIPGKSIHTLIYW
ncbi:lysosomal acid glucosylceramidase-like [Ischnura elegans]|uniref:lysosomal acid glucosylceramidase-like n=1 Tax=Ischnura elegans TaxID=197161 RepID=UPI001ED8B4F0|nr:lysosomal acid glucosylceramidase-like [Ischnura elegans]